MTYLFDGSYPGLLSVIFESYRLKSPATKIVSKADWAPGLFDDPVEVVTSDEKASRVVKGLQQKTSAHAVQMCARCFTSELPQVNMLIHDFVRKAMAASQSIEHNTLDDIVLQLHQINKKIGREIHRMHAFVRFQKTRDDLYYAVIEPDFDILALVVPHFIDRYPAMNWIIYDSKRHYGLFYDQQDCTYVTFPEQDHLQLRQLSPQQLDDQELDYQQAWQQYFTSTNIPERRNMKLHLQHVPKRYWRYLTEK